MGIRSSLESPIGNQNNSALEDYSVVLLFYHKGQVPKTGNRAIAPPVGVWDEGPFKYNSILKGDL